MQYNTEESQVKATVTEAVDLYRDKGYARPVAIHSTTGKFPPVSGTTGHVDAVTARRVAAESLTDHIGNVALVADSGTEEFGLVAVDVDDYNGRDGYANLMQLCGDLGVEWTESLRTTRRGAADRSGKRLFKVRPGLKFANAVCEGVDIVQLTHRYIVVAPSVVEGRQEEWYDAEGNPVDLKDLPHVRDLPWLNEKLTAHLTEGKLSDPTQSPVSDLSLEHAAQWLAAHTSNGAQVFTHDDDGRPVALPAEKNFSADIAKDLADPELFAGGAYDAMTTTVWRWVHDSVRYGAENVIDALERLSELYVAEVADRRSEAVADGEFARSVAGAVAKVRAEVEAWEYRPIVDYWPELFDPEISVSLERVEGTTDRWGFAYRPVAEVETEVEAETSGVESTRRPVEKGLRLRSFDELETIEPAWLWEFDGVGGIPLGGLTVFTGRGGVGKSTACRWLAAEVTRGTLPGEFYGTAHNVLYIAAEESNSAMVKPSLVAHGAVEGRVFFTEIDGEANRADKAYMAQLTELCINNDVKLVVVDPMSNYLEGANMNAAAEVREALRPWTTLAEAINGSVVAIFHQNKSGSSDIVHGVGGSAAISEVARSLFGFARDADSGECVMSQGKNNLGPFMPDLAYTLEAVKLEGRKNPGVRFALGAVSEVSAGDILAHNRQVAAGEKQTAKSWLRDHLRGLSAPALKSDVVAAAAGRFSESSLEKAAKTLGVRKSTRHEGGQVNLAVWSLD
jgi:hypothetical protein